jgi:YYY domain-containing protein
MQRSPALFCEGAILAALLALAAVLRFQGLDWDAGHQLHPDERFLTMVADALHPPADLRLFFATGSSPLDPRAAGFDFFVYGTLPLFLVRAVAGLPGLADYTHLNEVGRALAALFGVGTVFLTWLLGRLLLGPRVGLAAAALVTCCVLSIQQAHFFTVEAFGACFTAAAFCAAVAIARGGGLAAHIAFGAALGAAVACRINLALVAACWPLAAGVARAEGRTPWRGILFGALAAGGAAACVIRLANPYAFAGPGFFDLAPDPHFVTTLVRARALVSGAVDYPPSVQWIGRIRVAFTGWNLVVFGLGAAWGAAALVGIGIWMREAWRGRAEARGALGVLAVFGLVFFLYHAASFASTLRYQLPIVPILAILAIRPLCAPGRVRRATLASLLIATFVWALAFTAVYRQEHPRVAASAWMAGTLPAGAAIAVEYWDDALPLRVPGLPSFEQVELRLYDEEDDDKRAALLAALSAADYVVLSSDRLYRSIPRAPWRYPLARRYYELLFAEALGFRHLRSFESHPRLGSLTLPDGASEEAFRVYDHPSVHIFAKTEAFDPARVDALLRAVPLDRVERVPPRDGTPRHRATLPTNLAPKPAPADRPAGAAGEWHTAVEVAAIARWLAGLAVLQLAVGWLLRRAIGPLGAFWAVARTLAWVAPGLGVFWLASLGLAPHAAGTVRTVGAVLLASGVISALRRLRRNDRPLPGVRGTELAFLGCFAAFALLRALVPAIYWGEKPMDLAMLLAVERSRALPPADPWFAGVSLDYYYLGHLITVSFAEWTGVAAERAWNLALATLAGLTGSALFASVRTLTGRAWPAVAAVMLGVVIGNLSALPLLLADPGRPWDFGLFWATSRVVAGTINEFPAWSFLFGDLHAHVLALPLEATLVALGAAGIARSWARDSRLFLWVGVASLLLGALAATNPWSAPLAWLTQAGLLVTALRGTRSGVPRALFGSALLAALAGLVLLPFWHDFDAGGGTRLLLHQGDRAALGGLLTLFGGFLVIPAPALLALAGPTPPLRLLVLAAAAATIAAAAISPGFAVFAVAAAVAVVAWWRTPGKEPRAAVLLLALAFATVAGCEILTVSDRMNTVFKLHLQAWLLAAVGTAALLPATLRALGPRQRPVWIGAAGLLTAIGLATSAVAAFGLISHPPARTPVPTLDGLRFLETHDADELAAYRFLRREVSGVPVVLEAHGPPYRAFTRVAMYTGLPTVVGWPYHLRQQGRDPETIAARARDVRTFFDTTDLALAGRILDRYAIDFVFVGDLERETYAESGLAKLDTWSRLEPVFTRGAVTVYGRPGARHAHKSWLDPPLPDAPPAADAPHAEPRPGS